LPKLSADFCQNYDARYSDGILRLVRGVMKQLAEKETGADAGRMSDAIVGHLGGLHERLGLAPLALQPTAQKSGRKKKSA